MKESRDLPLISKEKFLECECNVGLPTKFWNPKMKEFISSKAKGRYMFDEKKSLFFLDKAYKYILDLVQYDAADIIFVGVKNKSTSPIVYNASSRVKVFHLTQRWLGGLLTNFKNISLNIKKLNELDDLLDDRSLQEGYTKKELIHMSKQRDKLEKFYGGIRNLQRLPDLLVIFNPEEDVTAVLEAKKMGIPVMALANTNSDPDLIDFIIPVNNSSPKSVYLISNILCDAVAQGQGNPVLMAYKSDSEIIIPEEYSSSSKTKSERGNISFI